MTRNTNQHIGIEILDKIAAGVEEWQRIREQYPAVAMTVDTPNQRAGYLLDAQVEHIIYDTSRPETESLSSKIRNEDLRGIVDDEVARRTYERIQALRVGEGIVTLAKRTTITTLYTGAKILELPGPHIPNIQNLLDLHEKGAYMMQEGYVIRGKLRFAHQLPVLGGAVVISQGSEHKLVTGLVKSNSKPQVLVDVKSVKK